MINYTSYALFYFGNFLFIFFVPDLKIQNFLFIYTLSSLIIGPISFIFFSKFSYLYDKLKIFILILNLGIFLDYNNTYLYFIYTLNIFFCDLFSSQIKNKSLNFYFKILLFLSVFPLIFNFLSFELTVFFRIILCLFLLFYLLIFKEKYFNLEINNPVTYQIFTNLNYFGTLFILSLILEEFSLKITYIIFQLGFAIILKYYDLRIRGIIDNSHFNYYFKYMTTLVLSVPIIFFFNNSFLTIFVLYYLSVTLFLIMKYKFFNYEKK